MVFMTICPILQNCRCQKKEIQQFYFINVWHCPHLTSQQSYLGFLSIRRIIFNTYMICSLSVLASNYPFLRLAFLATVGKRFDILCFLNAVSKIQFNFEISRTDNKRLDWFFCKIYLEILRRRHFGNWVQLISRELMQPW